MCTSVPVNLLIYLFFSDLIFALGFIDVSLWRVFNHCCILNEKKLLPVQENEIIHVTFTLVQDAMII